MQLEGDTSFNPMEVKVSEAKTTLCARGKQNPSSRVKGQREKKERRMSAGIINFQNGGGVVR